MNQKMSDFVSSAIELLTCIAESVGNSGTSHTIHGPRTRAFSALLTTISSFIMADLMKFNCGEEKAGHWNFAPNIRSDINIFTFC